RENPLELRRREVRVGNEARPLPDQPGRKLRTAGGGAPVLPHDRASHGAARAPLPDERRLTLIRDPDRGEGTGRDIGGRRRASPAALSTLAQISSGSCSTQPGSGKCCSISR